MPKLSKMKRLLICVLLVGYAVFVTGIQVQPGMKSFSSAIKSGKIPANTEKVLYKYEIQKPGGCGVITEQWFTGEQL